MEKTNSLDLVRARAIYNTEKRFKEVSEKEAEKAKVAEIAAEMTSNRSEKLVKMEAKAVKVDNLAKARAAKAKVKTEVIEPEVEPVAEELEVEPKAEKEGK